MERSSMSSGFFIFESRHGERMGYRCACCHLFTVFPQGETPRVWHCNRWSEYVEPTGFWNWLLGEDLPRVKPQAPAMVLRQRRDSENENSSTEV